MAFSVLGSSDRCDEEEGGGCEAKFRLEIEQISLGDNLKHGVLVIVVLLMMILIEEVDEQ